MKYGYVNYRKHLLLNKNERPMNLGDPIQSFAVLELFKRLGIPEEEIIPLDRYDLADYDGEDVIAVINGAENYEHFAYHARFLPVSSKIHPVFCGIHLHRELSETELSSLKNNQPIGCRDEFTVNYLKSKGIDAFLSGCFTMLFPKRDNSKVYDKIFIVDCSDKIMEYIPDNIKENAEYLTQIIRMSSVSKDYRFTIEETEEYNQKAKTQLNRYRDEAKLVITTRLHVASPCVAMGIPVVLVRETFDERYQFIDRFLPLYSPEELKDLDWENVKAEIPDEVKDTLIGLGKNMIEMAKSRKKMEEIFSKKIQNIYFAHEEEVAASKLPFGKDSEFSYCIWGVCMPNSYLLYEQMQKQYPKSRMKYAIDTYATGLYKDNIKIIHPDKLDELVGPETIILVVAPAAHKAAYEKLNEHYDFALIKGCSCDVYYK